MRKSTNSQKLREIRLTSRRNRQEKRRCAKRAHEKQLQQREMARLQPVQTKAMARCLRYTTLHCELTPQALPRAFGYLPSWYCTDQPQRVDLIQPCDTWLQDAARVVVMDTNSGQEAEQSKAHTTRKQQRRQAQKAQRDKAREADLRARVRREAERIHKQEERRREQYGPDPECERLAAQIRALLPQEQPVVTGKDGKPRKRRKPIMWAMAAPPWSGRSPAARSASCCRPAWT